MTNELNDFVGRSPRAIKAGQEVCARVIMHRQFSEAINGCASIVQTSTSLGQPGGALVQADSGMGKTTMLNVLSHRMPNVVRIKLDSSVDSMKLATKILAAFEYPALPTRPSLEQVTRMVDKAIERMKPIALIIDEFQHLFEGNRDITAKACTDWIKVRMDDHCMGFVGVGTTGINKAEILNRQFISRVSGAYEIKGFDFDGEWRRILSGFCVSGNMVNFEILKGAISKQVHQATGGNMRALSRLLSYAACEASERDTAIAEVGDFVKAFAVANGIASARANPFLS